VNKLTPKSLIKDTLLFILAIPLMVFAWIFIAPLNAVVSIAAMLFGPRDRPVPGRKKPRSNP
jgi:hypothetical protein